MQDCASNDHANRPIATKESNSFFIVFYLRFKSKITKRLGIKNQYL
jgi:hypothetical protein